MQRVHGLKLMITSPNELACAFLHYYPYDMQIAHYTRYITLKRIMHRIYASASHTALCEASRISPRVNLTFHLQQLALPSLLYKDGKETVKECYNTCKLYLPILTSLKEKDHYLRSRDKLKTISVFSRYKGNGLFYVTNH